MKRSTKEKIHSASIILIAIALLVGIFGFDYFVFKKKHPEAKAWTYFIKS